MLDDAEGCGTRRAKSRAMPESERKNTGDGEFEGTFPGCAITGDEMEFGRAMERFKREHRRPFPTWSEALAVAKSLGWRKVDPLPPVPK